jgi:hypothetical protein
MRYYEFKLKENAAEWQPLYLLLSQHHLHVYVHSQEQAVKVRALELEDLYVDQDGGAQDGLVDIEFWLDTPQDWDITRQTWEEGEEDHWLIDYGVTDAAEEIAKLIRRYYGDNWAEISNELEGSWGVNEDIHSAEPLPMRHYDGLYIENSDQGPLLYGVDLEVHGDRGAQGWYDFQANLSTGHYKILGSRANTAAGGELDPDELDQSIEEIIADVQKTWGTDWDGIEHELHGSWGVDESEHDHARTLADLEPQALAAARDQIAALVGEFKQGASRMVLQREQAGRLAQQLARIPLDQLALRRPVEDLPLIIYNYWYHKIQQGHPMGGSRSHDPALQSFLQDDISTYLEGDHVEISRGWGVGDRD